MAKFGSSGTWGLSPPGVVLPSAFDYRSMAEEKPDQSPEEEGNLSAPQAESAAEPDVPEVDATAEPLEPSTLRTNNPNWEASDEPVWKKYRNVIAVGLIAVVGGVAYLAYSRSNRAEESVEAFRKAAAAFRHVEVDSLNKALQPSVGNASLLDIAEEYSSTGTGNVANYLAGAAYLQQGNLSQASAYLEEYDTGNDLLSASALAARAAVLEEQNDFAGAAELYAEAAKAEENGQTTPYFLAEQARCLRFANDNAAAKAVYDRIVHEYPKSAEVANAEKYIALLGGMPNEE